MAGGSVPTFRSAAAWSGRSSGRTRSSGASTPPSFLFKVVGLFRMGFNEYDTRLAYVSLTDARKIGHEALVRFGTVGTIVT